VLLLRHSTGPRRLGRVVLLAGAAHYMPYEDFVQHGATGFLAKRDDWAR
jgi:hypothetical protein